MKSVSNIMLCYLDANSVESVKVYSSFVNFHLTALVGSAVFCISAVEPI